MSKNKPIQVKNVSASVPGIIFYGNNRRRIGDVFFIQDAKDFSVKTMVRLDSEGKEIRHLGGFDSKGKSLKGLPVPPGEPISQMTADEKFQAEAEERYQEELAKLRRDREMAKAPSPDVPEAEVEVVEEVVEEADGEDII